MAGCVNYVRPDAPVFQARGDEVLFRYIFVENYVVSIPRNGELSNSGHWIIG